MFACLRVLLLIVVDIIDVSSGAVYIVDIISRLATHRALLEPFIECMIFTLKLWVLRHCLRSRGCTVLLFFFFFFFFFYFLSRTASAVHY
jgi:hypothetical protein